MYKFTNVLDKIINTSGLSIPLEIYPIYLVNALFCDFSGEIRQDTGFQAQLSRKGLKEFVTPICLVSIRQIQHYILKT